MFNKENGNSESVDQSEKRYYITEILHLSNVKNPGSVKESRNFYEDAAEPKFRKSGITDKFLLINYVEEEVSYMTDFIFDEYENIVEKHFVPVTISKKENVCILRKEEG